MNKLFVYTKYKLVRFFSHISFTIYLVLSSAELDMYMYICAIILYWKINKVVMHTI